MKKFVQYSLPLTALLVTLNFSAFTQSTGIDKSTLIDLFEDRTASQTKFFKAVSNSTGIISVGIPAVLLLAGEIKNDRPLKQKALYIGESIMVSSVITWGMKYSINRTRPPKSFTGEIIPAGKDGSPSFPSGHTSQAFATATALYMVWPKWYVAVPAFGWASTVAYSRMYLGKHYPTDVAAGALVGIGSAWLTYKANDWINRKHQAKNLKIAL